MPTGLNLVREREKLCLQTKRAMSHCDMMMTNNWELLSDGISTTRQVPLSLTVWGEVSFCWSFSTLAEHFDINRDFMTKAEKAASCRWVAQVMCLWLCWWWWSWVVLDKLFITAATLITGRKNNQVGNISGGGELLNSRETFFSSLYLLEIWNLILNFPLCIFMITLTGDKARVEMPLPINNYWRLIPLPRETESEEFCIKFPSDSSHRSSPSLVIHQHRGWIHMQTLWESRFPLLDRVNKKQN